MYTYNILMKILDGNSLIHNKKHWLCKLHWSDNYTHDPYPTFEYWYCQAPKPWASSGL